MWGSASRPTERSRPRRPARAEGVEAVLGAREHRHAAEPPRDEAEEVGVHEMRVQDRRPLRSDQGDEPAHGARVGRERKPDPRHGDAVLLEPPGKVHRPCLALVEHREADVVAALAEAGEEQEQVVLGAGDLRHLADVEDGGAHRARPRRRGRPSPRRNARARRGRGARGRERAGRGRTSARIRSASASTSSRGKRRSSGGTTRGRGSRRARAGTWRPPRTRPCRSLPPACC